MRAAVRLLALLLILGAGMVFAVRRLYPMAPKNRGRRRDVILLLGCPARKDGRPSPILRERIGKAAELYREGAAPLILCTGGAVRNTQTEADVMARELVRLGVPEDRILRETAARSTWENLLFSRGILRERGLRTAVLVTSRWHLRRASAYALALGIEHTTQGAEAPPEFLLFGAGLVTLILYTQMFLRALRRGSFPYR
jgi:uncharacterized SAM-binding protein YcdF (DUF218 family)